MNDMLPPCEVVVKKIIPVVRSILATDLSNRYDMSQAQIAEKLSITQPAVSQYLNSGEKVEKVRDSLKENAIYSELQGLADDMAEDRMDSVEITREYCEICKSMDLEEILKIVDPESDANITEKECEECFEVRNED